MNDGTHPMLFEDVLYWLGDVTLVGGHLRMCGVYETGVKGDYCVHIV
jgi:hypothetical protein